jgi:hypothetical protein
MNARNEPALAAFSAWIVLVRRSVELSDAR